MPIRVLDPEVVSRIAAGEVVERPASVVKELVENALDAGSSRISVEVRGGGVGLIRVNDNGVGIAAAEMELAFQRYATSKINGLDDLESISSLGFRGEALPSIATVAQVEVVSAIGGSAGSYLSLKEGIVTNRGSQGRSQGTTVSVRNLLRSLPARLKFLKSPATENSHAANVVSQYALAFPEVKFTLSIDGRVVLRTPGSRRLIDSVIAVCGLEIARNMLEVGGDGGGWGGGTASPSLLVTGMVSSPVVSRSSRGYLSFFVNRRWINSRLLARAVEEAYHGLLMQDKHPVAIINISLPAGEVDVNIHPTKTEVKFRDERAVFSAVQRAVRQTLVELAPVPGVEEVATTYEASSAPGRLLWTPARVSSASPPPVVPPVPVFSLPALRLLGQLAGSYIVAEGPDDLYLVDQHAAHERILFEQFELRSSRRQVEIQGLLEPLTFEVSPGQDEVLKSRYTDLAGFGFTLEPFGDRTYLVRTVPALLHKKDWRGALVEVLDSPGDKADWPEKVAMSVVCHAAVKAGQTLTDDEMRELLRQLEQAALPGTCPHGRPTLVQLSYRQLERQFGRS